MTEAILLGLSLMRNEGTTRLKDEVSLPDKRSIEDKISTVLNWYFIKATRELRRKRQNGKRRGPVTFPKSQISKSPDPYDRSAVSVERERKIPDFKWGFADHTAYDAQEYPFKGDRDFDIECKRLGNPTSQSWKLNKQYVKDGIRRFVTNEHRYGEDESSGAMIGYIENMEFDSILNEVNAAITANPELIPLLSAPSEGWKKKAVSHLFHDLERPFPVSPFHLWHFWIDLRGCYDQND
ncbi:MAG: hypothetical protein V2I97_10570 [Desulfococcaceae bacterium]|nr:hypothetical protein [Desulfococcaceae bacterium]